MASLKDKLNAAAEAATTKAEEAKAAHEKHKGIVLREYPRLCNELLDRIQKLVGGANGVSITATSTSETLRVELDPPLVYGNVTVPLIRLKFLDRTMVFRPAGVGYIGICGAIEIECRPRRNPFREGKLVMTYAEKGNPEVWQLGVSDEQFHRPVIATLTDEILEEALSKALL